MSLRPKPFELIQTGRKTVELRLWDEKRQRIQAGDEIVFTHIETGETLRVVVEGLTHAKTFDELLQIIPIEQSGRSKPQEVLTALNTIYSAEKLRDYTVVGIHIRLLA